jgi:hypothetical protein
MKLLQNYLLVDMVVLIDTVNIGVYVMSSSSILSVLFLIVCRALTGGFIIVISISLARN